jgi:NADPH:quinone reductase-like Zn-dependent oxidoreductase
MRALTSPSAQKPLAWVELPAPKLGDDDVRVEVRAVGVNPVDWKMRQGELLGIAQRIIGPRGPLVTGVDFAGTVTAVGADVHGVRIGDRVVGGTDFSRGQRGSYAAEVTVRAEQVAALPPAVSFADAACLPVAGVTAHRALFEVGHLSEKFSARALILGAAGGVGHFAVQLARLGGAMTFGVCSARNVPLVERLGGVAIDYGRGDALAAAAAHGPYDVIVDTVGSSTYPVGRCVKMLKADGVHVLIMPRAADLPRLALQARHVRTILGRPAGANLQPLVDALASGGLQVVIQERIPLGEAERAHQISRGGKVVGKLVLVA